mmetsp:Transcript_7035/g.19839  ORF Transcript_7035/g.19839 Transcript_7035/m.19839 type:complete len:323 (-) Transcript_7035:1144-2112(-)
MLRLVILTWATSTTPGMALACQSGLGFRSFSTPSSLPTSSTRCACSLFLISLRARSGPWRRSSSLYSASFPSAASLAETWSAVAGSSLTCLASVSCLVFGLPPQPCGCTRSLAASSQSLTPMSSRPASAGLASSPAPFMCSPPSPLLRASRLPTRSATHSRWATRWVTLTPSTPSPTPSSSTGQPSLYLALEIFVRSISKHASLARGHRGSLSSAASQAASSRGPLAFSFRSILEPSAHSMALPRLTPSSSPTHALRTSRSSAVSAQGAMRPLCKACRPAASGNQTLSRPLKCSRAPSPTATTSSTSTGRAVWVLCKTATSP